MSDVVVSGSTVYDRSVDEGSGREVWVAHGFSLASAPEFCWKMKRDVATGRSFYVNLAGLGKKWKLPDIYNDPSTAPLWERLKGQPGKQTQPRDAAVLPPAVAEVTLADKLSALNAAIEDAAGVRYASAQGGMAGGHPDTPRHDTTIRESADRRSNPVDAARQTVLENYLSDLHQGSGMSPPAVQASTPDAVVGPSIVALAAPEAAALAAHAPPMGGGGAGGYGDDSLWNELSPLRGAQEKERMRRDAELHEAHRRELITAEKAAISELFTTASVNPVTLVIPVNVDSPSPGAAAAARHALSNAFESQRDVSDQFDSATKECERQRAIRDHQVRAYADVIDTLQSEQLLVVQQIAEQVRTERSVSTARSASADPFASPHSVVPLEHSPTVQRSAVAAPWRSPSGADSRTGTDVLIAGILEQDRRRIARLEAQLDDRDRAIAELRIADSERERRELALRIKMLEAMAAFRARQSLLEAEKVTAERERLKGNSARRVLPPHPLLDDMPED